MPKIAGYRQCHRHVAVGFNRLPEYVENTLRMVDVVIIDVGIRTTWMPTISQYYQLFPISRIFHRH